MSETCIVDASPIVVGGLAVALLVTLTALIWTFVRFSKKVSYLSVELNRERTREARRLLYADSPQAQREGDFLTWDRHYVAEVERTFDPSSVWRLVVKTGCLPLVNSTEHPDYPCNPATLAAIKQTILTGERPAHILSTT